MTLALEKEKHIQYLKKQTTTPLPPNYSHLQVPGAYWTLTALNLLNEQIPNLKLPNQNKDGGFPPADQHDSHITSSHYALLISIQFSLPIDKQSLIEYISSLQNEDGSFRGSSDPHEVDTRFSYCAVSALKLLNALDKIDCQKAKEYVLGCQNIDGGFGGQTDMESHGAYVFCAVGTLGILEALDEIQDGLPEWLVERQTSEGGFCGRPDKLPDVCYSWWILSALKVLNKENWVDLKELEHYILKCQDEEGGIADKPGNEVDVFHTFFGLAALNLMDQSDSYQLQDIDPLYAIPIKSLENLKKQL